MARPRKPDAAKILSGERRKCRLNPDQPKPPELAGTPAPPDYLDATAAEFWNARLPELVAKGLVTSWDLEAFAVLCKTWSIWRTAQEQLDSPKSWVNKYGQTATVYTIAKQMAKDFYEYAARFGLHPSGRASLKVAGETQAVNEEIG